VQTENFDKNEDIENQDLRDKEIDICQEEDEDENMVLQAIRYIVGQKFFL
jgi:hypothetical protein